MSRQFKAFGAFARGAHSPYGDRADIVIVGNGIAGLTTAVEARRLAPEQRIVIISEQSHPTINTPALKQFAIGKLTQEQLLAFPAGTERAHQIEVINARVEEIKSKGKFVCLGDGQGFGYGSLLLATGSKPNGLPASVPGSNFDGVLTLHRLGDYLDLRRRLQLREVNDAVVIGGGNHAAETVMALLHWGIRVHWLIRGTTFLSKVLDGTASEMLLEHSRHAGARVYTETEVVGIVGRVGTVAGVVTNHQQTLPCQLVLICTGITPVTTLAERCDVPLKHKHGIHVNDYLSTNIRDIYAAGDAAALRNPQAGGFQPRAHWHYAALQGRVAAAVMTGNRELAAPFGVPWHATQIGELSLLTVGDPLDGPGEAVTVTDNRRGSYRRLSMRDDRLVGYLSLGPAQQDSFALKRIIDECLSIRDIEKALLTGEFDARQYFAQRHSHAAHSMAATGKLAPIPPIHSSLEVRATRQTEPLLLSAILDGQHDVRDEEDPLQVRVERKAPVISSFKSHVSKQSETMKWVVPAILPEGLVILAGKQKVGKSWLALAMGLGIASGENVLGGIGVEQGNVLYLALEESEHSLRERLSQLLVAGASLHQDFEYATNWPDMDDDGLARLEDWLVSRPQARLVIIDAWTNARSDVKQEAGVTDHVSGYEAFEGLRHLADAYNVCILVHFHVHAATSDSRFDELTARLSNDVCTDGILHLKRARSKLEAMLTGTGRAYAQSPGLSLSFNDGCWKIAGNAAAPALPTLPALDTLPKARRAVIEVLHAIDRPMKPKEIALAMGKLDGTVRKMLFEMKASNLIKETDRGYVALVPKNKDILHIGNKAIDSNAGNKSNADKKSNGGNGRTYKQALYEAQLLPLRIPSP